MWEADGQQLSAHTCLYTIGVTSQPIKRWGYKQATIQVITLERKNVNECNLVIKRYHNLT